MTFDQYIAAFALGRVLTSELPKVAMQALDEGYDSVDLAALAGSKPGERAPSELDELWTRGLRHLNKPVPSRAHAARILRHRSEERRVGKEGMSAVSRARACEEGRRRG